MATEKVSLTLTKEVLEQARGRVGSRGLSSYVDSALRLKLQQDRLRGLLASLEEEHGPISDHVTDEVRREWPAGERRAPKRKPRA